jgi:hypothetical protein
MPIYAVATVVKRPISKITFNNIVLNRAVAIGRYVSRDKAEVETVIRSLRKSEDAEVVCVRLVDATGKLSEIDMSLPSSLI